MSIKYVVVLLLICSTFSATTHAFKFRDILKEEWAAFKLEFKKSYDSFIEDATRFRIFLQNKHMIAKHNQLAKSGLKSYTLKMNHYGDLMLTEFVQIMNGFKAEASVYTYNDNLFSGPYAGVLPTSIDWREKGVVTAVKDQGHCGSCWAFSSTGAVEGQHARKTGKLVSLSEQNLIDCCTENSGCNGGYVDKAFKYIKDHGIETEENYAYEAKNSQCRFDDRNIGATIRSFNRISQGNETKLMEAVARIGPVSVAIDASHSSFQFYHEGVYDEPYCSSTNLDHAVLVVGYGTHKDGNDYWLVKNSWGTSWGANGYILMSRNKDNQCGIASLAIVPLV